MNFKNWLIAEMPISKFQLTGQWDPEAKRAYGWSKQDTGILTNPTAVEKIHKKWSNTSQNFDFYFLKSKDAYKFREIGEVTPEWILENLKVDIQPSDESITVIFTQNTGTEKIPMTAWAIAHRLSHALRLESNFNKNFYNSVIQDFKYLLEYAYNINVLKSDQNYLRDQSILKSLAHSVGTMRSARQKNLVTFNEFIHELVAQWITTGKIKFNSLPSKLTIGRKFVGTISSNYELEEWNNVLENFADKYESELKFVFSKLKGKIFVM